MPTQSNGLGGTSDHNVTETAFDAVKCKLSAVTQQYFADDFLRAFVKKPTRRIPLIHRGYYLRHLAISQCVDLFLAKHAPETADAAPAPQVQIVSLGAGFDTLFFRLVQQTQRNVVFVEVDCEGIVDAKKEVLTSDASFAYLFSSEDQQAAAASTAHSDGIALQCQVPGLQSKYSLITCDLGDVARLEASLLAAGVDRSLPMLVIAECVVSYLDPVKGTTLLRWLAEWFADTTAIIYDPIALNDPFGETLQRYFTVKGCELRSLREFQSATDHYRRFLSLAGWQTCRIMDMNAIYAGCTSAEEKQRLSALEVFDEFADWMLCNAHYAIFLVSNTNTSTNCSHWSSSFCSGQQLAPRMEATALRLKSPSPALSCNSTGGIIIRTFEKRDLVAVQTLFESTHLEYKSKAVKKFVANRLRGSMGDMQDVYASFMKPAAAQRVLNGRQSCFWVAQVDDKIVGCIGLKPIPASSDREAVTEDKATAELCRLSVDASYRRRGIASSLVAAVEAFARASGYNKISLETIGAMESAQKLYGALGYQETGRDAFQSFSLNQIEKEETERAVVMAQEGQGKGPLANEESPEQEQLQQEQPQSSDQKHEPGQEADLLALRFSRCSTQTAGTELDLSNLGLHDLPFEVLTKFSSTLKKLNVRKNNLAQFPDELAKLLPHLAVLNASDNAITELPEQIGLLRNLQKLNLENNRVMALPKSFCKLSALEELNLRSNALEGLDEDLGNHLAKLKTLLLGNNDKLTVIPHSLGNLPSLRVVDLSGSGELVFVPEKVRRLHERNLILHSRAKRRELISRALRVRSVVAQTLSVSAITTTGKATGCIECGEYCITKHNNLQWDTILLGDCVSALFADPPWEEDREVDEPRLFVLQTRPRDRELSVVERLAQLEAERLELLGGDRAHVGFVELAEDAHERLEALGGEPQRLVVHVVAVVRHFTTFKPQSNSERGPARSNFQRQVEELIPHSAAKPAGPTKTHSHVSQSAAMQNNTSSAASIATDVQELRAAFRSGVTRDLQTRKQQLIALRNLVNENLDALCDALWKDLHKNPTETKVSEVGIVMAEIQEHLDFLEEWSKPDRVGTNLSNLPGKSFIYKEPLGVVNIIGTWNYPVQLTLTPLVGALSSGNTVLLRLPGDDTCLHMNELLANLVAKYLDNRIVRTVRGGVEASKVMLEQKFDLIFCTGGEFIGKIVAEAAAKHLTPTVLELGGKSPSIVDETCDITIAARRIAWGGFVNAGQTCVRPDYVMVNKKVGDKLVAAIEQELENFFGKDAKQSDSYCRLINDRSYARVSGLLTKDTKHVTCGGAMDPKDHYIAPTLLNFKTDFKAFDSSAVMSQEIFGPLMPIYYYDTLDEAIDYVNDHPKPLALYVFTTNGKNREKVLTDTSSGGVSVNDTLVHLSNPNLPFGGVGNSGMGAYHGKHSFDIFTHRKGVQVKYNILDAKQRYMPYTKSGEAVLALILTPIPHSTIKTIKFFAFAVVFALVGMIVKRNASSFPKFQ